MANLPFIFRRIHEQLETERDYIQETACQRNHFEYWLQAQVASCLKALKEEGLIEELEREKERVDIWFRDGGDEYWLEIKMVVTNYSVSGIPNKSKPITQQIGGCVKDARDLLARRGQGVSMLLLFSYPLPTGQQPEQWDRHLGRIRAAGLRQHCRAELDFGAWSVELILFVA